MADPPLLFGLDLGTTAIKGVVVDAAGGLRASAKRAVDYRRPREGRFELDPAEHLAAVQGVIRELAAAAGGPVRALAVAAAAGNALLADADGTPTTPILSWLDQRAAAATPTALINLTVEELRRVTGWPCLSSFPLAQLAWLKDHEPERYRATARCCTNTDWLLHQLCGEWVADRSTATTCHLVDQVAGRYHPPYLERLGIVADRLPPLVDPGAAVGQLTPAAAAATGLTTDCAVVAGSFDHPAAARACGVIEPGQLLLSCGTSWVGFFPAADRDAVVDAALLCDPFLAHRGGPWGAMFSLRELGRDIDAWVIAAVAPGADHPYRIFDELAAQVPPGVGGVAVDLRTPPDPAAGDRAPLARAVMEAAARLLAGELDRLAARGLPFTAAVMVGGPTASPVWPGIVAEVTGLEIATGTADAGARGAAILAGIGAGVYRDERHAWEVIGHAA